MDPIVIDIPGIGPVEFPASMSEDQINAAAKKLHDEANPPTKEPVVEKESPELMGYLGAGAGAVGAAGDVIYSKGRPLIRMGEKMLGMDSATPTAKPRTFLDPSTVAQQAIDRRTAIDPTTGGAVKNWAETQHTGEFLGGNEYGQADRIKKEAMDFEAKNPGQKVLPGSLLAVPETEAKNLSQQKAELAANQDRLNQAEVNKLAQTRAERLGERADLKQKVARKNIATGAGAIATKVGAPVLGGYELGSQGAQAYNRLTRPDLTASDVAAGATNIVGAGAGALSMLPGKYRIPAGVLAQGAAAVANWLDKRNPRNDDIEQKAAGGTIAKKLFAPVASKILKASEALGAHEGKNLGLTQTDNFGVHGGRMGGNRFPDFQNTSPIHQQDRVVWMNDSEKHAQDMINKGGDNTIWSTYIGAADQLKSNKSVFNDILQQHYGRDLTPEQIDLINKRIANVTDSKKRLIFPQSFDIRDKFAAAELGGDTFARRGAMADILGAGEGVGKTRSGIALPQYQDILRSHRDPLTEGVPTSSVGTRLFSVDPNTPTQYSQKYHPDYNWTVHGKDTGVQFEKPIPQHLAVPDWYNEINGRAPGKTHGNAWFSYMKDPQRITEEYLSRLQKEGYAKGGKVLEAAAAAFKKKFTPGFYHGSPANDIEAFDPTKSAKDPMYITPKATFVTRDPEFAESFLSMNNNGKIKSGSTMYPVNVNLGQHWHPNTPEGKQVIQDFIEKYPKRVNLQKGLSRGDWTAIENSDFLTHLKDTGHDTFHVTEGGIPNVGVLKPENIRGKFAKFNPEDADSPDFMKAEGGSVEHYQAGGIAKLAKFARHPHGQDPKVAQALEEYLKGNISQEERIRIMNQFLPMRQWKELPPNYSDDEIRNALMSNKQGKALAPVPAGMRVGNRLDIPAYTQNGVYVDTTHDLAAGNAPISYNRTGHLKDVEFSSKPNQAVRVGLGTKEQALTPMGAEIGSGKSPFALIKGTNVGTKDDEVRRMMEEMMKDPKYTQIGMDPRKHSQFYDKSTGMPVWAAEEKLQSGPLILAPKQGLETTSWDDPRLNLSDFEGKKYQVGGVVKGAKKLLEHARSVPFVHFSNRADLMNLDPNMYGTGIKGQEAGRLKSAPDIRPRSYIYTDRPDVRPEQGLGSHKYSGVAEDMYPLHEDPAGFSAIAKQKAIDPYMMQFGREVIDQPTHLNELERLIKGAGYKGYANDQVGLLFHPIDVKKVTD